MDNENVLRTDISFALVIRVKDIERIREIKEYILNLPDVRVIYQKPSFEPLYIVKTNPSGNRGNE